MSKFYEVRVITCQNMVIEMEDGGTEEEAHEVALNEAPMGVDAEATTENIHETKNVSANNAISCSDKFIPLKG